MSLHPAHAGTEAGPAAQGAQPQAGRIDEIGGAVELAPEPAMRLVDQQAEQPGEHLGGPHCVGVRQRRARHRSGPQVIEPRRMALQRTDDLAQTLCTGQLAVHQRDQLCLARQAAHPKIGTMLLDQSFEAGPRNVLQKIVEHAILVLHGVAFCCPDTLPDVREPAESTPCALSTKTQPDSRGLDPAIQWASTFSGCPGRARA